MGERVLSDDKLTIVKSHDDWKFVAEIKENAKGDPQVSVKARSDESAKEAGQTALDEYNRLVKEMSKP
jgi:hypothetical protein